MQSSIKELMVIELKQKLDQKENFYLIDVREDYEWTNGHLPKATHLCKDIIERDVGKYISDVNAEIVLYCGAGYRSAFAADKLQKLGYKNVFSLAGGFHAWLEANYEIE